MVTMARTDRGPTGPTTVVNLKGHRDDPAYADVVYVGRAMHRGGWHLPEHPCTAPTAPARTSPASGCSPCTAPTSWPAPICSPSSPSSAATGSAAGASPSPATPRSSPTSPTTARAARPEVQSAPRSISTGNGTAVLTVPANTSPSR